MIYRTVICIFIVNVFIGVNIEIVKGKLLRCLSVDNKKNTHIQSIVTARMSQAYTI